MQTLAEFGRLSSPPPSFARSGVVVVNEEEDEVRSSSNILWTTTVKLKLCFKQSVKIREKSIIVKIGNLVLAKTV